MAYLEYYTYLKALIDLKAPESFSKHTRTRSVGGGPAAVVPSRAALRADRAGVGAHFALVAVVGAAMLVVLPGLRLAAAEEVLQEEIHGILAHYRAL